MHRGEAEFIFLFLGQHATTGRNDRRWTRCFAHAGPVKVRHGQSVVLGARFWSGPEGGAGRRRRKPQKPNFIYWRRGAITPHRPAGTRALHS